MPESPAVVCVVGDSLAAMAAAARLARLGHDVTLTSATPQLGGHLRDSSSYPVDFPAPWRDLFKKSGRALDPTLATRGLAWTPLDDDVPVDPAWHELLDCLRRLWQVWRFGTENTVADTYWRDHRLDLWGPRSLADLAAVLPADVAGRVLGIADEASTDPATTPAFFATRLARAAIFGRWTITDDSGTVAPPDVLFDLLTTRLAERGVTISTDVFTHPDAIVWTLPPAELRDRWPTWRVPRPVRRAAHLSPRDPATPEAGPAWNGYATMDRLVPTRLAPRHYYAGGWTPAGEDATGHLLSAATATYLVHEDLTGEDVRPTNRTPPPRRPQANPRRRE